MAWGGKLSRLARVSTVAAGLTLLVVAPTFAAPAPLPEPHSSCDSEPTRTSTEGVNEADLTVINLTDANLRLYWLDYEGERVYYQDSPPHSSLVQETWLTHPWILTDENGTCYLLIVMNALQQTMTIGTTTGEEPVAPVTTTLVSVPDDTTGAISTTIVAAPNSTETGGAPLGPLVVGALAALGVMVGVLLATGRITLPWSRPPDS